jgi:hypothetical protein
VGTFLVVLGPADRVLAGRLDPGRLPGTLLPLDCKQALVYGRRTAAGLFPGAHPEVWAAVLPRESQRPASARRHVLVTCVLDGAAQREYAWHDLTVVSAARPGAIPWLRAAADAVASVLNIQGVPVGRAAAPAVADEPDLTLDGLRCRAQHANEILRAHLLAAEVAPKHKETLRQWADRIPGYGVLQAVSATTRRSRFPLRDDAADDTFNFNSAYFDPPLTQPAPQVPAQRSDFPPSSIKDILHLWAISAIDEWFACEETDLR